jgi:PleD family two-component response regulator
VSKIDSTPDPRIFKLLIVDYSLPGMNGLDMCSKIRREYKNSGIPMPKIIMNSGIDDSSLQKTALKDGTIDFWIVKKDIEMLTQIIKSILI